MTPTSSTRIAKDAPFDVAASLPDDLIRALARRAAALGVRPGELLAHAVREYLAEADRWAARARKRW